MNIEQMNVEQMNVDRVPHSHGEAGITKVLAGSKPDRLSLKRRHKAQNKRDKNVQREVK